MSVIVLASCEINTHVSVKPELEPRWFNPSIFDNVDLSNKSIYTIQFDSMLTGANEEGIKLSGCFDVLNLSAKDIAKREYTRWQYMKNDCDVLDRYYKSPESATSYWPATFNVSLLKEFPATAVPFLGGQGLDGRYGNLGEAEPSLTVSESQENSIKLSLDDMVVNYVLITRGDFNRDGYQDIFVRMEWYSDNSFGDGFDWIVLTKTAPEAAPMMLWRK
jgi:hypothetical protein